MTLEEANQLPHGLYRIQWKDGRQSLAAVGSKYDGTRWLCCTNWVSAHGRGTDSTDDWHGVASAVMIECN